MAAPAPKSFKPRIALTLLGGFLLFVVVTLIYVAPILIEPPPVGAIPDYTRERVMARLDGVVFWILTGSLMTAAALSLARWRRN